jgi:sugar diacid utilization regulator
MTPTRTVLASRPAAGTQAGRPRSPGRSPAAALRERQRDPAKVIQEAMIDAVLAGLGIASVAKLATLAIGAPVAIAIPRLGTAVGAGLDGIQDPLPELAAWVAERTQGRPAAVPSSVLAEVPVRFRDRVVGAVALLSSGHPPRADAHDVLHAAGVASVLELATQDAREETEQRLRGSFLEDLRSREQIGAAEIVRRAARLGCDLSGGAVMLCAAVTSEHAKLVAATIATEHPGAVAQQLIGADGEGRPRVYAALPARVGDGSPDTTLACARKLATRLARHAVVGLSSFHSDPGDLGAALHEAELVLEVLERSGELPADEIGSGIYRLLFRMFASHPDEVRRFHDGTVAALARHDKRNRTDLVHTLKAYLDSNCNMNLTAAAIFAHRHTVAYRLDRIRELTGLDPTLSEDRECLGLGLKIHRIVARDRVSPAPH